MAKAKKVILPGEAKLKNIKHELFSVIYAGGASHYFGNATRCYLHAFGKEEEIEQLTAKIEETYAKGKEGDDERRKLKSRIKSLEGSARSAGALLLANNSVSNRCNYLLDRYLSDDYADREMAYVISQREDLMAKVAAYREVARVKERIRGAGAITGEFSFVWDDDSDTKKGKAPVLKKATVRAKAAADDRDMMAEFL